MKNLMDNNINAYKYYESTEVQIQSICEPLYNLGVKWFGYIKIFLNGSYLWISSGNKQFSSNKEFMCKYYSNINDQGISFTRDIESVSIEKSLYSIFLDKPNKRNDPILDLCYHFDLWPYFYICKNKSEFFEAYCFSMNKNESHASGFYLNNLDILEHFCDYFNIVSKDIIDCSNKRKLGYFEQQFNFKNQSEENFRAQQIEKFLQETYMKTKDLETRESEFLSLREVVEGINYLALGGSVKNLSKNLGIPSLLIEQSLQTFKDINNSQFSITAPREGNFLSSLSPRQKECLFLLTRGKTAKQIGQILGISYRTVETHVISLKSKMNCTTKNQLIEKVFETNKFSP